ETFQNMYKYSEFFYEPVSSLLEYLPKDGLLMFDEMGRIQEAANQLDKEETEFYTTLLEQQQILPGINFSYDWSSIKEKFVQQRIYLSVFLRHIPNTQPENVVNIS